MQSPEGVNKNNNLKWRRLDIRPVPSANSFNGLAPFGSARKALLQVRYKLANLPVSFCSRGATCSTFVAAQVAIRAVRDHEDLEVLEERTVRFEALLAVTVDLVERLPNGAAALFQLDLHQRQPVHKDGHIVAVRVRSGLLELLDDLYLVAADVTLIDEIDVLNPAVIEDEIEDVVVMELAGFVRHAVAGLAREHDKRVSQTNGTLYGYDRCKPGDARGSVVSPGSLREDELVQSHV